MTRRLNYLRKHPETLWLIAILGLSTLLRLAFLHEPFDRDEGQYATIAQTILRGGLPYRDAIEIKPPGTFYLYAMAIALFGATTEAVRIFTAFYSLLTIIAVFGVAHLIAGVRSGLCAALVYGVFSTFPLLQGTSNSEVFLVLPLTLGVWFFLLGAESKQPLHFSLSGLCAAFALLIKPVALPIVVLQLLLLFIIKTGDGRWKEKALNITVFLLPVLALAAVTLSYFYLRGGLNDLLYWTVEFPRHYKDIEVIGPSIGKVLIILASTLELPAIFGISSALWLAVTRRTVTGMLPLLMIITTCLAIALPGKYFPHYFILIMPFLAIPAGFGLSSIFIMHRLAAGFTLFLLMAAIWFAVMTNHRFYTVYSPEQVSAHKYAESTFVESVAVASYLQERTSPEDYIFQWGFEPELYFLAKRRCPNPFLVNMLPSWSKSPVAAIKKMQQSLIEKKPAYIILQPDWSDFAGIYEINEYVTKNCHEEKKIGYALLFRCSTK